MRSFEYKIKLQVYRVGHIPYTHYSTPVKSQFFFIAIDVAYTFKLDFLQPHESEQKYTVCLVWEQK